MAAANRAEADPAHDDTLDRPLTDASTRDGDASASLSSPELSPGARIGGRYEVIRRLGEGGMGTVYEAEHTAIQRRVAVKVLHAEFGRNQSVIERFLQEARAVNAVRHRHVVEVFDFGVDHERPWLVMELLAGESLGARIERQGPGDPAWAVGVLDPVCRALHQAHLRGFIHRDVKPDNIFLAREEGTPGDVPKILDFGIAKNLLQDHKLTATGAMVGTPSYMAPEQITDPRAVSPACDQYALGVMLYEMLTGRLPHEAETFHGMILGKVQGSCVPITTYRADLPGTLGDVVMRALALDPANRFPDLDALRTALLESLTAERPVAVAVVPAVESPPEPAAAPTPRPRGEVAVARAVDADPLPVPAVPAPRSRAWLAALLLVPLLLAAWFFGGARGPAAASPPAPPTPTLLTPPPSLVPERPSPVAEVTAPAQVAVVPPSALAAPDAGSHRRHAPSAQRTHAPSTARPGRLQIDTHNPLRP